MEVPYSITSELRTLAKILALMVHSAKGQLAITSSDGYTTKFVLDIHDGHGEWVQHVEVE